MGKVVVICVDGNLKDLELPFARRRLEEIRAHIGASISCDEERSMLAWIGKIFMGKQPIDEERLTKLLGDKDLRTKVHEDQAIAEWILNTWEMIEELKRC